MKRRRSMTMFIFIFIFSFLLVGEQIELVKSLECEKIESMDCIWNVTCRYRREICNETKRKETSRGGIYCSTLIEMKTNNEIHLKHSGCMFDQEASKTCFNQSICQFKFTNKDQQYLHCCCDQSSCNLIFDLSNPQMESSDDQLSFDINSIKDECRLKQLWRNFFVRWTFLLSMSFLFFLLIFIGVKFFFKRSDRRRFCSNLWRKFSTKRKEKENENEKNLFVDVMNNDESELMMNNESIDERTMKFNRKDFQIEFNPIKKGKFTEIYRSKYQNKTFILKLFKENFSTNEQQRFSSFQHEKQIYSLNHFQHENLLKYFGSMENVENRYLILDYCSLGSLRDYLKTNFIRNDEDLLNCCSQIANGIEYLHRDFSRDKSNRRYPIAHRDIKSDNILLVDHRHFVLSDFAMSIHLDEQQISSTDQQQQMGTPRYMSPEILSGTIGNELNSLLRSDVYSMSLVFWEILSRSIHLDPNEIYLLPFDEQLKELSIEGNPTIEQMLTIVLSDSPRNRPIIRSTWRKSPLINEKLLRTIEQCWDSTPEGRISASLVAHRLNSFK